MLFIAKSLVFALASVAAASPIRRQLAAVPDYVKTYAPLIYLYSGESYFPSDLAAHVANTVPDVDFTAIALSSTIDLTSLASLNSDGTSGTDVYLTAGASEATASIRPTWFYGVKPVNGLSALTPIVVVDKGNGTVDAFYFTFYSFNLGTKVVGIEFGNHVGDWEHSMIRFLDGVPQAIWLSQHAAGQAFTYEALQKGPDGLRPVIYSATGSHALYSDVGTHDHTLPGETHLPEGFVEDHTDAGTLWDPILNVEYYTYDGTTFAATSDNPDSATNWLEFVGLWGDKQYPTSQSGQYVIFGQAHYGDGPTGPEDKDLMRTTVCSGLSDCVIFTSLELK